MIFSWSSLKIPLLSLEIAKIAKIIQNWEKLFSIIFEILWNYYGIGSQDGKESLRTMFRMPHDCLIFYCLSLDFLRGLSRQTTILISYGFLCFTAWLVYAKQLSDSTVYYVGNKLIMWKYILIKTTSQVRQLYKIQFLLLNIWLLYLLGNVTCCILGFNCCLEEIKIDKSGMGVW